MVGFEQPSHLSTPATHTNITYRYLIATFHIMFTDFRWLCCFSQRKCCIGITNPGLAKTAWCCTWYDYFPSAIVIFSEQFTLLLFDWLLHSFVNLLIVFFQERHFQDNKETRRHANIQELVIFKENVRHLETETEHLKNELRIERQKNNDASGKVGCIKFSIQSYHLIHYTMIQ